MCPCSPQDLTLTEPSGPTPPAIVPFGVPFSLDPGFKIPTPNGFPEDLLEIFDLLQLILPSGTIKPDLNLNFQKDIFDAIMKLLDKFFPFLMLYKFFLPILDLILCILEVICAINNPIKLIRAIKRLFRTCIPAFLALFPIFALILMLLSLLLLILALIEYLINQILKLIDLLLRNIRAIAKALSRADSSSILTILKKIGTILCMFQNFFVLLALFKTIIDLIKDMLKLLFKIPPCDDGDGGDDTCCSTDVCPDFIRNNEEIIRSTGTLQYYNTVAIDSQLTLPIGFAPILSTLRNESWQFYDDQASIQQALINITQAYDLPAGTSAVFFPTDATYNASTPPKQAPYTCDLRLFYNPLAFNRPEDLNGPRFVRIKDCIVTFAPTTNLSNFDNSISQVPNGVIKLAGGTAVEDNGNAIFINGSNGTIENFIHFDPTINTVAPNPLPNDGYTYQNVEYTFKINHEVLLTKTLITLGCIPTVALDRAVVNTVFGGNAGVNLALLNDLVNGDANTFPDLAGAQDCLNTALINLRNNVSEAGVANFQAQTTVCLNTLKDATNSAIEDLVSIGFDPNTSSFSLDTNLQFTSNSIVVSVQLNERNGQPMTAKFPDSLAEIIAKKIVPVINFGEISQFTYDGEQTFTANLTSSVAGSGKIEMLFENKIFTTLDIPADLTQTPTLVNKTLDYTFVYSPGTGDGKAVRDEGDISRE